MSLESADGGGMLRESECSSDGGGTLGTHSSMAGSDGGGMLRGSESSWGGGILGTL